MNDIDMFSALVQHHNAHPDRRGWVHVDCPSCGKEFKRGQSHFSFNDQYGHCFVCGNSHGIMALYNMWIGKQEFEIRPIAPRVAPMKKKKVHYRWMDYAEQIATSSTGYHVSEQWQEYKPVTSEMIKKHRLGIGALPASRCKHERLLIPLVNFGGKITGFRGRSLGCDCGKWLSPAGNKATLYNWQCVESGSIIAITENPIDAIIASSAWEGVSFVATLSTSYWEKEWTEFVRDKKTELVIIAYDNDDAGRAATERLAKKLRIEGVLTRVYEWNNMNEKSDLFDLINDGGKCIQLK